MLRSTVPVFKVGDLSRSVRWYQEVLGFQPISNGVRSAESIVLMARDDIELILQKKNGFKTKARGDWNAYFRLTGVDTLFANIKSKAEVLRGPEATFHHDREIDVRDPNGYVLTFGEWESRQDQAISMYDLHPVLPVADIEETVNWYKEILGFKGEPAQEGPPYTFAMLYQDRIEMFFMKVEKFGKRQAEPLGWGVYIRAVDTQLTNLYEQVKDKVQVVRPLQKTLNGYLEFEIADINGHVLCFSELVG